MNFTLKVIKKGQVVQRVQTHSKRRFYNRIRTINWQKGIEKVYLRINYDKKICSHGCLCSFYNDGEYKTKKDLIYALLVFTEK